TGTNGKTSTVELTRQLWRMAGNIGVDTALGAIPLVGDAFDLFFRSNTRNLKIIKRHLDKHHPGTMVIDQ
ncbi:hypothetical protein A4X03_0g8270, partial [Tilletia caries]